MSNAPLLTDTEALARNRTRAALGGGAATFLHEAAATEIEERLNLVNRAFTSPAIVTGAPDFWRARFAKAQIVEDRDVLELEPGAHDLIIHAMALHWANDPVGQLVQVRHALRPDGLFLCILPAGQSLYELRSSLAEAEAAVRGGLSPRVLPMGDIRDLGAILQRAGFAMPVADALQLRVTYQSPLHLMRDLRAMGEANAMVARSRKPLRRAVLSEAVKRYRQAFEENGRVHATFELITLTGWAPSPDQPKPLRPGSASARLADALNTQEHPLGEPATPDKL